MSLEADLKTRLTEAMRAKDLRSANVIRMLNTRIMERRTAKGFTGVVDDALVLEVIGAYRKSMVKAREEFLGVGERGKEQAEELAWEVQFCETFLPKGLGEDELRAAVRDVIAKLGGAKDPKLAGRVVGEVMKLHKGRVEPGVVKAMADAELK